MTYYNIKSHKKQGFTLYLEDIFLEKLMVIGEGGGGRSQIDPPPPPSVF